MERHKRAKAQGAADPAPLAPEARARLEAQVAGVVGALEAGVELAALKTQITPDPQDPDWDAHLMAALGALSHPAIPPLLAALFGEARDKVRRKALKKTLHRLKTRGVAFPDDLLPKEEVSFGALAARGRQGLRVPHLRRRRKLCNPGGASGDIGGQLSGRPGQRSGRL